MREYFQRGKLMKGFAPLALKEGVSVEALVTSALNSDTASSPELWPVHQLSGPQWSPKWNAICNSPEIFVRTAHLKQIRWLSDTQIQMVQQSVKLITAWQAAGYLDIRLHTENLNYENVDKIWRSRLFSKIIENLSAQTSNKSGLKKIFAVHFGWQVDPHWQQPEVELSSTSRSDALKTLVRPVIRYPNHR